MHRKFDLIVPGTYSSHMASRSTPALKNSSSTLALSKPDIGPQSSPRARAAMMRYPPCSVLLRFAVTPANSGLFAKYPETADCGAQVSAAFRRNGGHKQQLLSAAQPSFFARCPAQAPDGAAPSLLSFAETEAGRACVGAGWPPLHQVVKLAKNVIGDEPITPTVVGAGSAKKNVKSVVVQAIAKGRCL